MDPWAFLMSGVMLAMWAVLAMPVAIGVWYRRRLRNELQNLLALRRQLGDSSLEPESWSRR